MVKKGPGEQR